MVKIGIIVDNDINSFLPDISICLYESLRKHKCFNPYIISRDKKLVANNIIIKDIETFLESAYADNFTVFFNVTKKELSLENLTFFNIVEYSNVNFLTLVFKKNDSSLVLMYSL